MQLFGAIRQRAKWIESQADALIGEHGKNAYTVACYMERQANSLSTKIFWQAIKKVVVARAPGRRNRALAATKAGEQLHLLSG